MPTNKEFVRKENFYTVDILVGNSWVVHAQCDLLEQAKHQLTTILEDSSVVCARIYEHLRVSKCSLIDEVASAPTFNKLPKMEVREKIIVCPVCNAENTHVQFDGAIAWLSCVSCERTIPV